MAGFEVSDPSWGSIFSDFASAFDPAKRARAQLLGQSIAEKNMTNEQLRAVLEAQRLGSANAVANWDVQNPPGVVPTPAGSPAPFEGPATPDMERQRVLDRDRLQASTQQGIYTAKNPKDVAQAYFGLPAINKLAAGGIPADRATRDVMETMLGTVGATIPGYDQAKMPPKPYQATDPATGKITYGVTQNGQTDAATGKPIGPPGTRIDFFSPLSPDANQYKASEEIKNLAPLAEKARRGELSMDDAIRAGILLDQAYPVKMQKDVNGRLTPVRDTPIPQGFQYLAGLVEDYRAGRHEQPSGVPAPPALAPPLSAAPPDRTSGGLAGVPVQPAVPAVAAAAPVVPAPGVAPRAPGMPGLTGSPVGEPVGPGDANKLRQDFAGNANVKRYESANNLWNGLAENVKVATPQADINMIYALAKILDPESVVREGEQIIFRKTGGVLDQLRGMYDKVTSTGASLSPDVRARLVNMGEKQMGEYWGSLQREVKLFGSAAKNQGINVNEVIPDYGGGPKKVDRKTISSIAGETLPPRTPMPEGAAAPAAPAGAAPGASGALTPAEQQRLRQILGM